MSALSVYRPDKADLQSKVDKKLINSFRDYINHKKYDVGKPVDISAMSRLISLNKMLCRTNGERLEKIKKLLRNGLLKQHL